MAPVKPGAVNDEIDIEIAGEAHIVTTSTSESRAQLGVAVSTKACALVKASSIILMVGGNEVKVSARMRLAGRVTRLVKDAAHSEVVLGIASGASVVAVVTNDSVDALVLVEGAAATAIFKASSVIVGVAD